MRWHSTIFFYKWQIFQNRNPQPIKNAWIGRVSVYGALLIQIYLSLQYGNIRD